MIKLTRLPNPTGALFHNTYKVSGTLTYQEVSAFEKGIQNCFGFDSSEAESFRNIEITDAGPTDLTDEDINELQRRCDILETAANTTTLEVSRLLESNKHAWEAAGLERQACINANQERAAEQRKHAETQKELDRVTGALHLEQKSHDDTKQTLGRSAMKFGDLIRAVREYADKHAKFGTACHEGHVIAEDLFEILRTTMFEQ